MFISPGQDRSGCNLWYLQKSMNIKAFYFKGLLRAVTLLTSLSGLTFNTCALWKPIIYHVPSISYRPIYGCQPGAALPAP